MTERDGIATSTRGATATERPPRRRRRRIRGPGSLTDRGRALAAAGVTLTASGVVLGFVDLTRVGLLALVLPILALGTNHLARPRLHVERHVHPATLIVGERAEVTLTIRNRTTIPCLTMLAQELLPVDLGGQAHFVIRGLGPHARQTLHYRVRVLRRGLHQIGPLSVRVGDPFGLTRALVGVDGSVEVIALPKIHALGARTEGLGGDGSSGSAPTILPSSGLDDVALRAYHTGDDLRRIHWPVTAHRGELIVRQEGRSPIRSATLILDPDLATGPTLSPWGTSGPDRNIPAAARPDHPSERRSFAALEWGIEALASIATHLDGLGYTLQLVTPATLDEGRATETLDLFEAVRMLAVIEPTVHAEPSMRPMRPARVATRLRAWPAGTAYSDRPAGADGATEPTMVSVARDTSVGSGLVVLIVGTCRPHRARDLLSVLPPGIVGLAILLDPGVSNPTQADRSTSPGRRVDAIVGDVHELLAFAASGGWHACVVDGPQDIAEAWARLVGGAAVT